MKAQLLNPVEGVFLPPVCPQDGSKCFCDDFGLLCANAGVWMGEGEKFCFRRKKKYLFDVLYFHVN